MRLLAPVLLFCTIGLAQPAPAPVSYIERGKIELDFSGNLVVPHSAPGSTSGSVVVDGGYYVSRNSLLGGEVGISAASGTQSYSMGGHYRYLFSTRNPKLFPFVGASPGVVISHFSGSTDRVVLAPSYTHTAFTLRAEAGIKYFVAQNVSVEAAYNLLYAHQGNVSFKSSSVSRLFFGLAFTF